MGCYLIQELSEETPHQHEFPREIKSKNVDLSQNLNGFAKATQSLLLAKER